jgi:phage gp36-like protein
MPNYATTAELIARFETPEAVAHLTNVPDGPPDQTLLTKAIEAAESTMNSYFAARYKTPIATADADLRSLLEAVALDLAVYELYSMGEMIPESRTQKMENRMEWLNAVRKGDVLLPASSAVLASTVAEPIEFSSGYNSRTLSRSELAVL